MKHLLASLLLVLPVAGAGAEQLIPAGSVMQCMVSEPNVSSKTTHIGDPVLCQLSRTELYGRSVVPYGSYLVGHFEDYKDPGHFVGKGWIELKFDRMVVGNDTVLPVATRVVATSTKYPVDGDGKIHGTGHPVRDAVEWAIPVLWPIDLINLPRRGPRVILKPETRLTVKLLDDVGIPTKAEVQHQPELVSRFNYADNTAPQQPAPVQQAYAPQPQYAPQYAPQPAPIERAYAQQSPTVVIVQAAAPAPAPAPVIVQAAAPAASPVFIQQQAPQPVYYAYPPPPRPMMMPYGYYRPY